MSILPQRRLKVSAPLFGAGGLGIYLVKKFYDEVLIPRGLEHVGIGAWDTSKANVVASLTPVERLKFFLLDSTRKAEIDHLIRTHPAWRYDFNVRAIDWLNMNVRISDKGVLKIPARTAPIVAASLDKLYDQSEEVLKICSSQNIPGLDPHKQHKTLVASLAGGSGTTIVENLALLAHLAKTQAGRDFENSWTRMLLLGPTLYKDQEDFMPVQFAVGAAQMWVLNALSAEGTKSSNPALAGPLPGFDKWLGNDRVIPPGFVDEICFIEGIDDQDDPMIPALSSEDVYQMVVFFLEMFALCPDLTEHLKEIQFQERDQIRDLPGEEGVAHNFSTCGLYKFSVPAELKKAGARFGRIKAIAKILGPVDGPPLALTVSTDALQQVVEALARHLSVPSAEAIAQSFIEGPAEAKAKYLEALGRMPAVYQGQMDNAPGGSELNTGSQANILAAPLLAQIDGQIMKGDWRLLRQAVVSLIEKLEAVMRLPFPDDQKPDTAAVWEAKLRQPTQLISQRSADLTASWEIACDRVKNRGFIRSWLQGAQPVPPRPRLDKDMEISGEAWEIARYIQQQMKAQARQEAWERRRGMMQYIISRLQRKAEQIQQWIDQFSAVEKTAETEVHILWQEAKKITPVSRVITPKNLADLTGKVDVSDAVIAETIKLVYNHGDTGQALAWFDSQVKINISIRELYEADIESQVDFADKAKNLAVQARIRQDKMGQLPYVERPYIICPVGMAEIFRSNGYEARFTIFESEDIMDELYLFVIAANLPARVFAALAECEYVLNNLSKKKYAQCFPWDRYTKATPLTDDYLETVEELITIALVGRLGSASPAFYLMSDPNTNEAVFGNIPLEQSCPLQQVKCIKNGEEAIGWSIIIPMPTGPDFELPLDAEDLAEVARLLYRDAAACRYLEDYIKSLCEDNRALIARNFVECAKIEASGYLERLEREEQVAPFMEMVDAQKIADRQKMLKHARSVQFIQRCAERLAARDHWVAEITGQVHVNFLKNVI